MGLSGIIPIGHGVITFGLKMALSSISLGHMIAMGAFYVVGALIYGNRYVLSNYTHYQSNKVSICTIKFIESRSDGILESLTYGYDFK